MPTRSRAGALRGRSSAGVDRALPPGPRLPSLLQLLRVARDPTRFLDTCTARYGADFTLQLLGFGTTVVVSSPESVRAVITTDQTVLAAGEGRAVLRPVFGDTSLMLLDGQPHRLQRQRLLPLFRGNATPARTQAAREAAQRSIAQWPTHESFALYPRLEDIAIDVIVNCFFGAEPEARRNELAEVFLRFLRAAHHRLVFWLPMLVERVRIGPWRRFHRTRAETDEVLYSLIRERRSGAVRPGAVEVEAGDDLLGILLDVTDDADAATDVEIRDAIVTILVAGHETTAIAMAWALEAILAHPDVAERIRSEIDATRDGEWLSVEHVARLEYLDAVIAESMRLYPINPLLPRRATAPVEVGPYALRSGDHIVPSPYLAQRRPESFPDPLEFKPERFVDGSPDAFAMFPFGQGVRRCIGAAFARYEMKVVLAAILSSVEMRPVRAGVDEPTTQGDMVAPKHGTRVVVSTSPTARRISFRIG